MTNTCMVLCSTGMLNFSNISFFFFFTGCSFPSLSLCVHQKIQDLDERRVQKLAQGYILFSETEKHVMPIIGKCLEGITKAGTNVNESNVSRPVNSLCSGCFGQLLKANVW